MKTLFLNTFEYFFVLLLCPLFSFADVRVTNVSVKPRWPWNGLVDITYSIECDEKDKEGQPTGVYVDFMGYDNVRNESIIMKTLSGDGVRRPVEKGGPYMVTWNAIQDKPAMNSADFQVNINAFAGFGTYMVVDLSGGKNAESYPVRYTNQPPDLSDDTCRTTELWLRQIQPGTFTMGSPSNEVGRISDETLHEVTLTQMFYIGVFECTQTQWNLVMGNNPSYYKGDCRPVEMVSYDMIRGTSVTAGAGWPKYGHAVDSTSFMGKLQAKTGLTFDLPTEAQWEYACRGGTTTALNSGKNLKSSSQDNAMGEVGRYNYNKTDGKGGYSQDTTVGCYLPNAWGLYDMHGNVWEWCLDWYGSLSNTAVQDPHGADNGTYRIKRGGTWCVDASWCRSAYRFTTTVPSNPGGSGHDHGFRVLFLPEE